MFCMFLRLKMAARVYPIGGFILLNLAELSYARALPCPPQVLGECQAKEQYFQDQIVDHFKWNGTQRWSQRFFISASFFDNISIW